MSGATSPTPYEALALAIEALEPFAEIAKYAKGKPDACWCGQAPAVIRYRDLETAASALTALHHTISTTAALANWHAALSGQDTTMRPGIGLAARPPVGGGGE